MSKSDLVDLELRIIHETINAYLLTNGNKENWVPKSQCENNKDGTFTMKEWLAIEKEFI